MKRMIEVCCGSYADCIAAWNGGAKRVELNSALSVGGLTPTLATLQRVKQDTDLKVICMSRPRAAGFCYDTDDVETMLWDAKLMLENGADGIAFGFLNRDRTVCKEATEKMVELVHSYGKEAVFHRAFDMLNDPFVGCETLIALGVDRILTSGQQAKAMDGMRLIKTLQENYGTQIQILPGSGMNAANAKEMMDTTGVYQVHSSCKNYATDNTTSSSSVTFAYLSDPHTNDYDVVDEELVRKLVEVVEE
mgnify:CR=1 FL=1